MNAPIPGSNRDTVLNTFIIRGHLVTQSNPLIAYRRLREYYNISEILERAVFIEMRRLGFSEFVEE